MWLNAIRLSIWERSRCNEIYTGTLIGLREPKPLGWQGYDAGLSTSPGGNLKTSTGTPRFEGYLKARLPGDTEWRRVFVTILRGANVPSRALALGGSSASVQEEKKSRRSSLLPSFGKKKKEDENIVIEELPGDGQVSTIGFFAAGPGDSRPGKKDQPICVAQHVFYGTSLSSLGPTKRELTHKLDFDSFRSLPRNGSFDQPFDPIQDRRYLPHSSRRISNGMGSRWKIREARLCSSHARIGRSRRHAEMDCRNCRCFQGSSVLSSGWVSSAHSSPLDSCTDDRRTSRSTLEIQVPSTSLCRSVLIETDNSSIVNVSSSQWSQHDRLLKILFTVVDTLEINESRPRAIRATFHSTSLLRLLSDREPC